MKNQEWTDLTESLTLKGVNITGDVLGRFGIYTVKQSYENKSGKTLEVFYTFPLSKTASVYDFTAKIGDKTIRGIVKEKSQAKKAYQRAIVRGDSAYLLDRESDNVFTVTLGKIAEGENAEIVLSYIDVHDITERLSGAFLYGGKRRCHFNRRKNICLQSMGFSQYSTLYSQSKRIRLYYSRNKLKGVHL